MVEHHIDGQRVVEIDPIGQLFGPVERTDGGSCQLRDVALKNLLVGVAETAVADADDAVFALSRVSLQQPGPHAVVDGLARCRIVDLPARPQIGARRRRSTRQPSGHKQECRDDRE